MPRIPEFTSTRLIPGESGAVPAAPGPSSMEYGAWERAGNQFEVLGHRAMNVFGQMQLQQEKNDVANKTLEWENQLNIGKNKFVEDLSKRTDYWNYDTLLESQINDWKTTLAPRVKGYSYESRLEQASILAFNHKLSETTNALRGIVTAKKLQDSKDKAIGDLMVSESEMLKSYSSAISDEEKENILNDHIKKIYGLASLDTITWKDAETRVLSVSKKAQFADALKIANLMPEVGLELLDSGKWDFDPLTAAQLEGTFQRKILQKDAERRRIEAEIEKQRKVALDKYLLAIQVTIMGGGDWTELVGKAISSGIADHTFLPSVLAFQKSWNESSKRSDKEENKNVKDQLTTGLYGDKITVSEKDLKQALDNGDINTETYKGFLAHRTSRLDSDRKEYKSDAQRRQDKSYENARSTFSMRMQVTGPGATLVDREAKSLEAAGLTELFELVYTDKMEPGKARDLVINRYATSLDSAKDREALKLRRSLIIPNSATATIDEMVIWLDNNKKAMSPSTFQAHKRMLMEIEGLENMQREAQEKQQQQPKIPGKKKYKVTTE